MVSIGFRTLSESLVEKEISTKRTIMNLHTNIEENDYKFRQCPKCGQAGLTRQETCDTSINCAFSKCG